MKDEGLVRTQVDQRNGIGKPVTVYGVRLTGKGRRAIGRWPHDASRAVDELLTRLDDMIGVAPAEERSKLVRARDTLLGVGRDLLVEIAGAAATRPPAFRSDAATWPCNRGRSERDATLQP